MSVIIFGRRSGPLLIDAINELSLAANLKACYDAGDPNSYPGSGQNVTDLSGTGSALTLGANNSVGADDPGFVASGKSSRFTFDGADLLNMTSAPSWTRALHKVTAIFTLFAVVKLTGDGTIFSTRTTGVGGLNFFRASNKVQVRCDTSVTSPLTISSDADLTTGVWHAVWCRVSENGGSVSALGIDGAVANTGGGNPTFSANYSSPTGTDTTQAQIGSGFANTPVPSGTELRCFAAWQGIAVSTADLISLYNRIRRRVA